VMLHFTETGLRGGKQLTSRGKLGYPRAAWRRSVRWSKALISSARNVPGILVRAKLRAKAGPRRVSAGWKGRHSEKIKPHQNVALAISLAFPVRVFAAPAAKPQAGQSASKNLHTEKSITSYMVGWIAEGHFYRWVEKGKALGG
jgi:hypothetical protein